MICLDTQCVYTLINNILNDHNAIHVVCLCLYSSFYDQERCNMQALLIALLFCFKTQSISRRGQEEMYCSILC